MTRPPCNVGSGGSVSGPSINLMLRTALPGSAGRVATALCTDLCTDRSEEGCQVFHRVGQRRARCGGRFSPLPGMGCRIRPGEATLMPSEPGGVHVNSVYLALLALSVPALTFTGLWFWRLRYQRRAGGQLTETEIAARIAARQDEL